MDHILTFMLGIALGGFLVLASVADLLITEEYTCTASIFYGESPHRQEKCTQFTLKEKPDGQAPSNGE